MRRSVTTRISNPGEIVSFDEFKQKLSAADSCATQEMSEMYENHTLVNRRIKLINGVPTLAYLFNVGARRNRTTFNNRYYDTRQTILDMIRTNDLNITSQQWSQFTDYLGSYNAY